MNNTTHTYSKVDCNEKKKYTFKIYQYTLHIAIVIVEMVYH